MCVDVRRDRRECGCVVYEPSLSSDALFFALEIIALSPKGTAELKL